MRHSHVEQLNGLVGQGAYFVTDGTITLMRQVLRGIDRGVLARTLLTQVAEPA
jgi:hypothetical protein